MSSVVACVIGLVLLIDAPAALAATEATIFRLFLQDGSSIVSYGEFARVDDAVVFSMPTGGTPDEPRLHVVSLPVADIDWPRTDRYAAAARYQRYADTRGEEDFQQLSGNIARVLNEIALSSDKKAALDSAQQARRTLADWPAAHYGYRQRDVREVVALLDEAISDLRASAGLNDFSVALVATPEEAGYEPILGMPTLQEQIDQAFHVAALIRNVPDRIALLQDALAMLNAPGTSVPANEVGRLRRLAEEQIHAETVVDQQYAALSRRLLASATSAAGTARIQDIERILGRLPKEDRRLGQRRPEVVEALSTSIQHQLDEARRLRLLRDQWQIRRSTYREYQRAVGGDLMQLVKMQPSLEAIKRLAGPAPATLFRLRGRLDGGAVRLQRMAVPDELRSTHELLVSAWRFAETAVDTRHTAIFYGDVGAAWQASSSAAGAMLMIARVQLEIRALLEPPHLQ